MKFYSLFIRHRLKRILLFLRSFVGPVVMSQKGCSPDNSACEGLFGRLKNEMFYNRSWSNVSIDEFIAILDQYIHWYSEKRRKLSLGGLSPVEYRKSLGLIAA